MLQSKAILKKTSAFSKVSTCYSFFPSLSSDFTDEMNTSSWSPRKCLPRKERKIGGRPPIFFVPSKVDIFSGLFLEMVISHDNYKER